MTEREAIRLYVKALESFGFVKYRDFDISDPAAIAQEMRDVVAAKSDRAAGAVIQWWGCWDEKYTATRFARRVRQISSGQYSRPGLQSGARIET